MNVLFVCGINSHARSRDGEEDSAEENEKSEDTMMVEREGSKVEKMKKQYRPRQVNRAPALYNAGYVKRDNEVSLNGEAKKSSWKTEWNNLPHLSRITIFYKVFQEEFLGHVRQYVTRYAVDFKLKRMQVKVEKSHNCIIIKN